MKQGTFTEEQIVYALRQAEAGTAVADVCRKLEGSERRLLRQLIRPLAHAAHH